MGQGMTGGITGGADIRTADRLRPPPHPPATLIGAAGSTTGHAPFRRHPTRTVALADSPELCGDCGHLDVGGLRGVSARRGEGHRVRERERAPRGGRWTVRDTVS